MLGVKKSRTTPYHPQGDPQPERFNRTLLNMLGTLDPTQKSKWSQHLTRLVHAYNCTKNDATGYSPYFLMFGREARLPVDLCFGVSADGTSNTTYLKYVSKMQRDLQAAYQVAQTTSSKMNQGNKERYDQKVRCQNLSPGDRVLIRSLGFQGKHKLADRWSPMPYVVESQMSELPVYRLKPVSGEGPTKVLHRNHILPLGQFVRMEPEVDPEPTPCSRALRSGKRKDRKRITVGAEQPHLGTRQTDASQDTYLSSDSESEADYYPGELFFLSAEQPEAAEQQEAAEHPVHIRTPDRSVSPTTWNGEAQVFEYAAETSTVRDELLDLPQDIYGGEDITAFKPQEEEAPCLRRSQRERRPPERSTYNRLGEISQEPITATPHCSA